MFTFPQGLKCNWSTVTTAGWVRSGWGEVEPVRRVSRPLPASPLWRSGPRPPGWSGSWWPPHRSGPCGTPRPGRGKHESIFHLPLHGSVLANCHCRSASSSKFENKSVQVYLLMEGRAVVLPQQHMMLHMRVLGSSGYVLVKEMFHCCPDVWWL